MGYEGVELACWGDHFDVQAALNEVGYVEGRWELLKQNDLSCFAISAHLVGQAVCDLIDERHAAILPPHVYGDGDPEGVRQRAAQELIDTAKACRKFVDAGQERFIPILDAFESVDVNFALEVHPTEIAFDIVSSQRALDAINGHKRFGFNYDPSHLGYQGVDYVKFIREFSDRIYHVHMKDAWWGHGDGTVGVFGGHTDFADPRRFWDFRSVGRGDINFEEIIVALNEINYRGPLSVEWEDARMERFHGATESCAYTRSLDFPTNQGGLFDSAFDNENQ